MGCLTRACCRADRLQLIRDSYKATRSSLLDVLPSAQEGPQGLQRSWSSSLTRVWISTPVTGPITRAAIR